MPSKIIALGVEVQAPIEKPFMLRFSTEKEPGSSTNVFRDACASVLGIPPENMLGTESIRSTMSFFRNRWP